jgi:hypothetical protein
MRLAMTAFALLFASFGCATTVHPGLANAPGLGGTRIAGARVHDVIANGQDSCGRRLEPDPGPLRYRLPPCRQEVGPGMSTALAPLGARNDSEAQRWMEHYHFGWPCRTRQEALASGEMVAWSPALATGKICGLP